MIDELNAEKHSEVHEFNGYFEFLKRKVCTGGYSNVEEKYNSLLYKLLDTEFKWCIDRDSNRAKDGVLLRNDFLNSDEFRVFNFLPTTQEKIDSFLNAPCSVLEMLIALAQRCEFEIMGEPGEEHPEKWFWIFIKNLKLDKADTNKKVETILNKWMGRRFDTDGHKSIFPLDVPYADQTKCEIWEQMNQYLNEKFPIL